MCELPGEAPDPVNVAPHPSNTTTMVSACCQADPATAEQLLARPARSLTIEEALYVLVYLGQTRRIAFVTNAGAARSPRFSPECVPLALPPAHAAHGPPALPVVSIHFCVDGVQVINTDVPSGRGSLRNIDVRLAVFVFKLARLCRLRWSATALLHAGLMGGGPHAEGRAFDFTGIRVPSSDGSAPSSHTVRVISNWGEHDIPASLVPATGRTLRFLLTSSGEQLTEQNLHVEPTRPPSVWPVWQNGDYMNAQGRLLETRDRPEHQAYLEGDPSVSEPMVRDPRNDEAWGAGRLAAVEGRLHREDGSQRFSGQRYRLSPSARTPDPYAVFLEVYQLATTECSDRPDGLYHPCPNLVGSHRGRVLDPYHPTELDHLDDPALRSNLILHPDYASPNPWYPQAHADHMHIQIGPTGPERERHRSASPPVYQPCPRG